MGTYHSQHGLHLLSYHEFLEVDSTHSCGRLLLCDGLPKTSRKIDRIQRVSKSMVPTNLHLASKQVRSNKNPRATTLHTDYLKRHIFSYSESNRVQALVLT